VLSKRLPQDFVENTLMPHLESQLLENIKAYTPAELAQIARAYSKMEPRQYALCKQLSAQIMDRMVGFEAVDIVDVLGPMWIMLPGDDVLFEAFEERILKKLDDFTALNLIGLIRVYNKRASKHHKLLAVLLPRLRELLKDYEAIELSEMLMSVAQSPEAAQDMDVLMVIVPEIERRYSEVSLVHAINNVWALVRLGVFHEGLMGLVANDLRNSRQSKDITPAYMSRIAWIYRRCDSWDMVSEAMMPLIRSSAAEFRCGEFARLAQALPDEEALLRRIADFLRAGLQEMGRKDFLLFFLGCVHGGLLEVELEAVEDPLSLVGQCLRYAREEQDNFKRDDVQKIVYLLQFSEKHRHVLASLPQSWNATKDETLDYIRARA